MARADAWGQLVASSPRSYSRLTGPQLERRQAEPDASAGALLQSDAVAGNGPGGGGRVRWKDVCDAEASGNCGITRIDRLLRATPKRTVAVLREASRQARSVVRKTGKGCLV
jgi:hypothetical protein